MLDAWLRKFRIPNASGTTPALRAGSFDWDYASFHDHAAMQLHEAELGAGVGVTGSSALEYASNTVTLDVLDRGWNAASPSRR